jgi:large subunit ribosomal protein L15
MNLNDAKSADVSRTRKVRVGRGHGSGCGKTSGRGHGGQRSRSGFGGRLHSEGGQMPLARRLPKKGFNNANYRIEYEVVNVWRLGDLELEGEITPDSLKEIGMLKKSARWLKVLGKGNIEKPIQVAAHHFSMGAKEKIEAAGGTVRVLPGKGGIVAPESTGERHAVSAKKNEDRRAAGGETKKKKKKKKRKK